VFKDSNSLVQDNYFLETGFIFIATKPTVISTVLGSCVSVSIYDKRCKVGGMNNFQFPYIREKRKTTVRYGNVAIFALIHMMTNNGSKLKHLEAQIFGGAYNPMVSPKDVGRENIMVARDILEQKRVFVVSEDVGGEKGRKIVFDTNANEIAVLKVDRLRKGDWYPYEGDR
jgi:chemotaxis protein CheD